MFARRGVRVFKQARLFATEAGENASASAPASADANANAAADNGKMNNLLEKLAAITDSKPAAAQKSTMIPQKRRNNSNNNNRDQQNGKNASTRSNKNYNNNANRNRNRRTNNNTDARRAGSNNNNRRQTVSHFDRYRNPKKSLASSATNSSNGQLNSTGLSFADLQEARALYIRNKVDKPSVAVDLHISELSVFDFIHSRAVHKTQVYDVKNEKFAKFHDPSNIYQVSKVSKADLELSKDKLGYDTKSRILRALEQITRKRGFKLKDVYKKNVNYLPYNALSYPYANTTLPNNLNRPKANLSNLSNISEEEIKATIATVVKGERPELIYDPKKEYKTEQLKVNAQVVVNNLNRNAQLQVDNLHLSMAKVMLGNEPIKSLPQPILAPKNLK